MSRRPIPNRSLQIIRKRLISDLPKIEAGLMLICLETGCRCCEAVSLNCKDIDYVGRRITIRSRKGGNLRPPLKISYELITWLRSMPRKDKLQPRSGDSFKRHLRYYFARIANSRDSMHQMRHSWMMRALELLDNDLLRVAKQSGHKSIDNVAAYLHVNTIRADSKKLGRE